MTLMVKNLPAMQETQVQSLGWEDLLEKGMATHSSVLAWRVPLFLPGKLHRGAWRGLWRVRHSWVTTTFTFKDIQDKLSSRQLYTGAWRAGPRSGLAIWIVSHYIDGIHVILQGALVVKKLPANAGDIRDAGSIPGLGRTPGGGHGNPLQYCCLENPMERGAWWTIVHRVTESQTQLRQQLCIALWKVNHSTRYSKSGPQSESEIIRKILYVYFSLNGFQQILWKYSVSKTGFE